MPDLSFLIHLPFLRIEEVQLPFAGATLWRTPFERYDEFTAGAFRELRARYEATAPVFLAVSIPFPEDRLERRRDEVRGTFEAKAPSGNVGILDQFGLYPINWAQREIATPAWTALLLAEPASALGPPRWSQTFMTIDGGFTLNIGGNPAVAVRVQGEADHEYLFLPDAASDPIPAVAIARAATMLHRLKSWEQVPDLHDALNALRATGLPTLSRHDRLTLSVQALESLLLPEVHSELKRTFARRAIALLAGNSESARRIDQLARELYRLRSENVHGGKVGETTALDNAHAEQILAAAIAALGNRVDSGRSIAEVRAELDTGHPSGEDYAALISDAPTARASNYRLAARNPSSEVYSSTSTMSAPEGRISCWSPLMGLMMEGLGKGIALGPPPTPALMPLSPAELAELEERIIRRDFLARFIQEGEQMAVLFTVSEEETDPSEAIRSIQRMRDLGVIALRLAGYDRFHDPELFGPTVYEGPNRVRYPTVLRQTIAERVRHKAEQSVTPNDTARLSQLWQEVWAYEQNGRSSTIEQILSLFRRSFDRDFLEPEQRALLLIIVLDRMLGRFHATEDPVQLEQLVSALVEPGPALTWFSAQGRAFRNRVAHGEFSAEDARAPIEHMSGIVSQLVLAMLRVWNADSSKRTDASKLLTTRATAMLRPTG
jgi:hypothetical protein